MIAGLPSHGPGEHEHNAGVQLLAAGLKQAAPNLVNVDFSLNGQWPTDKQIAEADTIVVYSDGGKNNPILNHLSQISQKMAAGCGIVCIHYAVQPGYERAGWPADDGKPASPPPPGRYSTGKGAEEFREWLGGCYEPYYSVNPHWLADFKSLPIHPISRGVSPFSTQDEWYFHMRFKDKMEGVAPILISRVPLDITLPEGDDYKNNPEVRREVLEEQKPQVVAWAVTRNDGGRGFGFCGGHFHSGWANENQRKLVLNAILWTAKAEVPPQGIATVFSDEQLKANLDKKPLKKSVSVQGEIKK